MAESEYGAHYRGERNRQGLDNRLIAGTPVTDRTGRVGGVIVESAEEWNITPARYAG
jgi:hypothetical protein